MGAKIKKNKEILKPSFQQFKKQTKIESQIQQGIEVNLEKNQEKKNKTKKNKTKEIKKEKQKKDKENIKEKIKEKIKDKKTNKKGKEKETKKKKKEKKEKKEKEKKEKKKINKREIKWCSLENQTFPLSSKKEVIFNEIAWMGTKDSSSNEWIELKNLTGDKIDLTGWQIQNKNQKLKIIFPKIKIAPYGLLLLERTDDNSVPNIKSDLIYKGVIKNSNETLFLFDKNCNLKDKVKANPSWLAGDNLSKRTMERKKDLTWQTSKNIGGTPKKENSSGYIKINHLVKSTHTNQNNSKTYPKILISEVYLGSKNNSKDEFVELYNPNNEEIDLTNWYLQRKTKNAKNFSSYISSKLFSGKKISKNGYFLIVRENSSFKNLSDVITKNPLTSNNTLVLKNPNREIVDEINWKEIPLNKSYGRKWKGNTYKDTNNCELDFEIQKPTPKKRNLKENSFPSGISSSAGGSTILAVGGGHQSQKESIQKNQNSQVDFCEIPSNLEPSYQMIFSEIAWAGNQDNPYDEWIELKNNSDKELNLTGFQILGRKIDSQKLSLKIILTGKTLGNTTSTKFYLLEKNNSSPFLKDIADQIYTGANLKNDEPNFELYLFDNHCQLLDYLQATSSWPAGNNQEYRTMERNLDYQTGWHTFSGEPRQIGQVLIYGTPKEENSTITKTSQLNQEENTNQEEEINQEEDKEDKKDKKDKEDKEDKTNQKEDNKTTQQDNDEYSHILKNMRILNSLKISEVLVKNTSTSNNNFQFIELYNSTSTAIDLKEVSLQYLGSRGKKIKRISRKNLGTIPGYGFYLIASTSTIFGKKADSTFLSKKRLSTQSTGGTIFLVATTTDLDFSTNSPFILDKLAYGSGNIYPEGKAISSIQKGISWERKAYSTSTQENYSDWQFAGNGYDSNNNLTDFIFQNKINPQNSTDLPEPEEKETEEKISQDSEDYFLPPPEEIKYDFSISDKIESGILFPFLTLNLSWKIPKNFPFEDPITEIYYFSTSTDLELSSSTLFNFSKNNLSTTTATSTSIKTKSFNQYLYFGLKLKTKTCQKSSQIIWQKVLVPSFIKNAYFYKSKLRTSQTPNYFLELEFENKDWIDNSGEYQNLILINLNQPPQTENPFDLKSIFSNHLAESDCFMGIFLKKADSSRIIVKGIKYPQERHWQFDESNLPQPDENDLTLRIPFDFNQTFSSSTYITFSFYQRGPWNFHLFGFDAKKYFFGKMPQFFSPSQPKISLSLDKELPSLVKILTTPSVDYDSLDENLFYQFNLTDSNSSSTFIFNLKSRLLDNPIYYQLQENDSLNISLNVFDEFNHSNFINAEFVYPLKIEKEFISGDLSENWQKFGYKEYGPSIKDFSSISQKFQPDKNFSSNLLVLKFKPVDRCRLSFLKISIFQNSFSTSTFSTSTFSTSTLLISKNFDLPFSFVDSNRTQIFNFNSQKNFYFFLEPTLTFKKENQYLLKIEVIYNDSSGYFNCPCYRTALTKDNQLYFWLGKIKNTSN